LRKAVSGWDKALYYFCRVHAQAKDEYIWFIEDDVFFYSEGTLSRIDENPELECDLLSNKVRVKDGVDRWLWNIVNVQAPPPWYHGMMCAVRFTNKLLNCIDRYASSNGTLCFLEAMFPTLAKAEGMRCIEPVELSNIYYRHKFSCYSGVDLYHPLKGAHNHKKLRMQDNKT
jgi:hypothetical protein